MTSFNNHTCEFRELVGEPEFLEQRAVVILECEFVEITSSSHSEKHDETFYQTGMECDNQRRIELELDEVTPLDGPTDPGEFHTEADTLVENAEINHYVEGAHMEHFRLIDTAAPVIIRENDDYRIRYE